MNTVEKDRQATVYKFNNRKGDAVFSKDSKTIEFAVTIWAELEHTKLLLFAGPTDLVHILVIEEIGFDKDGPKLAHLGIRHPQAPIRFPWDSHKSANNLANRRLWD